MLATVARVVQYTRRGSLWSDESMLALNIASRTFGQLTAPLNHDQYAPLLFLWAERLMVDIGGVSASTLRLLSLLAGIAVIFVVARLSERVWGKHGAWVSLAMVGLCPALIFYSSEAKPYAVDTLVSATLVWLALQMLSNPASSWRLIALGGAGVVATWLSSPAVFTLAGIGAALLLGSRPWTRRRAGGVAVLLVVWAGDFLLAYNFFYSRPARSDYITQFWTDTYPSLGSSDAVLRTATTIMGVMHGIFVGADSLLEGLIGPYPLVVAVWLLVSLLMLVGAAHLLRSQGAWAAALSLGPTLVVGLASLLGLYPMVARLTLFAVPLWIVVMAGGVLRLASLLPPSWRSAGLVLLAATLPIIGLSRDGIWLLRREQLSDAERVIQALEGANRDGDPVYVNALGLPIWLFYTTDWSRPDRVRLETLVGWNQRGGPAFENAPSRGRPVQPGEGANLVLRRRSTELLGLPTGMQLRSRRGLAQLEPDPGWASNEVRRITAAGGSQAWLIFLYPVDASQTFLTRELDARGARRLGVIEGRNAIAYRYALGNVARPEGAR